MNKVVILSIIDYAGSGFNILSAVRRHTDIDIILFGGPPNNKYLHPTYVVVNNSNKKLIQEEINRADILHFKGDWPPEDGYLGMQIPKDKPIIITTAGSFFRKKIIPTGIERFMVADYGRATLKTSITPDLLYPEYSDIWTPHPIDSETKLNIWHKPEIPYFLHVPSSPLRKGTEFVKSVFEVLKKKIKCKTEIITNVDWHTARSVKKNATIYFDQFVVGFYGNSALEAMQYGIPVVNWISPRAIEQSKGKLNGCPVVNCSQKSAEKAAMMVLEAMEDPTLSQRTKEWCDKVHGYRATAKQWNQLYENLLK